jgi:MYXO-CTERM domain-containing protein
MASSASRLQHLVRNPSSIAVDQFNFSERNTVRKTIGASLTALTLLFGGAGVANATAPSAPMPSSTTTTMAAGDDQEDSDNTGLWGLAGLLGLVGLVGLKRRNDQDVTAATAVRGPNTPRA